MKKSIEISGTIICLDDIITISAIKKWREEYTEYNFEFSYRSYNGLSQKVVIQETNNKKYYCTNSSSGGEHWITIATKKPLTELREQVINIVKEND